MLDTYNIIHKFSIKLTKHADIAQLIKNINGVISPKLKIKIGFKIKMEHFTL